MKRTLVRSIVYGIGAIATLACDEVQELRLLRQAIAAAVGASEVGVHVDGFAESMTVAILDSAHSEAPCEVQIKTAATIRELVRKNYTRTPDLKVLYVGFAPYERSQSQVVYAIHDPSEARGSHLTCDP